MGVPKKGDKELNIDIKNHEHDFVILSILGDLRKCKYCNLFQVKQWVDV